MIYLPWRAANPVQQNDAAQKQARIVVIDARLRICRELSLKIGDEIVALDEERSRLLGLPIRRGDEEDDTVSEETEE
jgi:hypothetical protein